MTPAARRAAEALARALNAISVARRPAVEDGRVVLPLPLVRQLNERIAFMEGGYRLPFVRALISRPAPDGVTLSSDEALHLARALDDIAHEEKRRRDLKRGIIRGPISGKEAVDLARRFPGAFGGR